jgi:hypothetical protein
VQFEIFAELQATIGMWNSKGSLDVMGHSLTCRIGEIVKGENENIVTNADPAVFTAISEK